MGLLTGRTETQEKEEFDQNISASVGDMTTTYGQVYKEAPQWVESGSQVYMIFHPGWLSGPSSLLPYMRHGTSSYSASSGTEFHMKKTAFTK